MPSNHPNRKPAAEASEERIWRPTPVNIRTVREKAGLSIGTAAGLVDSTRLAWERWESGTSHMHRGLWRLFLARLALRAAKPAATVLAILEARIA